MMSVTINNIKWYTIEELSKTEGVTIQTIYNRIKEKTVEKRKVMGRTVVKPV